MSTKYKKTDEGTQIYKNNYNKLSRSENENGHICL